MNAKQRAAKEASFRTAIAGLIHDQRFHEFMDVVREQREIAIEDACTDRVIASDRATLTALGEVRAYKSIIAIYEDALATPPPETAEDGGA